jgi:type III secretion system PrgH/EprH family protein
MITSTPGHEIRHLRILFGPLFGADLTLASPEVFFCVGDNTASDGSANEENAEHSLHHALGTLYIPFRADSPNFRVRFLTDADTESDEVNNEVDDDSNDNSIADFEVDFLSTDSGETRREHFNTICRYGDIVFAVKRETDAWSDEVSSYTQKSAFHDALANPQADEPVAVDSGDSKVRLAVKVAVVLLLGAAVMGFTYWEVQQYIRTQKVASVASLLARAPARNSVLPGHDGKIHVLGESQDNVEWDKQVLLKAAPTDKIEVASLASERERLEHQLDTEGIDFVTVRMEQPDQPVLVLSAAVPVKARDHAARSLQQAAPYATHVQVLPVSIAAIEQEARAALAKSGVRYRRLGRRNGATFEVAEALNDGELASLQDLVLQFSRKWGTRRVDFKVAMRTDWLKGKSYREGGEGYVLLDHASWYFPQPLKGTH